MTSIHDGYVDLQINGYAGIDFNSDTLTPRELHSTCRKLQEEHVAGVLATIVTADIKQMMARLRKIVAIRENDSLIQEIIWGIHIEGPFINPEAGYIGAHPYQYVRQADLEIMQRLLDAAGGLTRIVTLAPEQDERQQVIQHLVKQGIVVSAGHCNPTMNLLCASIDAGLSMFTHLGNGCPLKIDRHDNIIQRVLSLNGKLWVTFIADGAHVPYTALRNYLSMVGSDRAIIVTDASAAAGMGPGRFSIGGIDSIVGDDLVPRHANCPQYFAGSALTMSQAAINLTRHLALDHEVPQLCTINPRLALGM